MDALLKDICSALLESDVNVKLVSQLRSRVRTKVKTALESGADKGKEANRRYIVQKARIFFLSTHLSDKTVQAVFDELVTLVDPGVEPFKPKKGQPNVIMAVGLQVLYLRLEILK